MPGVKGWEVGSSLDFPSGIGISFSIFRAFAAALCLAAWAVGPSPRQILILKIIFPTRDCLVSHQ